MNKEDVKEKLVGKKWVVENEHAYLSYHFTNGKITLMPSKEECAYTIHEIVEAPNNYRIDIFSLNETEVWDIAAIGNSYQLWVNNTAAEKGGKYRILKLITL